MKKTKEKRVCPQCGSDKILRIIYGHVSYEDFQKIDHSKYHLGGCCDTGIEKWHCDACEEEF